MGRGRIFHESQWLSNCGKHCSASTRHICGRKVHRVQHQQRDILISPVKLAFRAVIDKHRLAALVAHRRAPQRAIRCPDKCLPPLLPSVPRRHALWMTKAFTSTDASSTSSTGPVPMAPLLSRFTKILFLKWQASWARVDQLRSGTT